jgi:hypothetical protein
MKGFTFEMILLSRASWRKDASIITHDSMWTRSRSALTAGGSAGANRVRCTLGVKSLAVLFHGLA